MHFSLDALQQLGNVVHSYNGVKYQGVISPGLGVQFIPNFQQYIIHINARCLTR